MDFSNRGASDEMALLLNLGIGSAITAASVLAFELLRLRVPGVYDYRRVVAAASGAAVASTPPDAVTGPVNLATAGEWSAAHPRPPAGVLPPPPGGWFAWLRPLLAALTAPPSGVVGAGGEGGWAAVAPGEVGGVPLVPFERGGVGHRPRHGRHRRHCPDPSGHPVPRAPFPGGAPFPTAEASGPSCRHPEEAASLPPPPHPDALAVTHGLDVVVALRFLRWQAALFTGLTLLAGGLGPLYRSAAGATAAAAGGRDGPGAAAAASAAAGGLAAYSLGAVPPGDRLRLGAALVVDIAVTAAVGATLYWQAAAYARARVAHAARRGAPEALAVLLTDIPADAAAAAAAPAAGNDVDERGRGGWGADGTRDGAPGSGFCAAVTAYWEGVLGAGAVAGVVPAVDPAAARRAVVRFWAAVDAAEKAEWRAADAAGAVPGRGRVGGGGGTWRRLCGIGGDRDGGGGRRRRRHRLHPVRRPVVRPVWVARRTDGLWGCLGWGPAPPEDAVTYWRRQVDDRRAAVVDAQAMYGLGGRGGPIAATSPAGKVPCDLGGDPLAAAATAAAAATGLPDVALAPPPPVAPPLPRMKRPQLSRGAPPPAGPTASIGCGESGATTASPRAAVVVFRTPLLAAIAAQLSVSPNPLTWTALPAPPPPLVHWTKLSLPPSQVLPRRLLSLAAALAVTLFWVAPLTAITGLANARALASVPGLHWLSGLVAAAPAAAAFVEGLLPPLLLSTFMRVVPALLRAAVNLRRLRSRASVDARVVSWLFHFQTTSFLFVLLAGSLASNIKVFIAQPPHMLRVLASSVARQGLFFLQYVLAHALWFTPPELTAWWRLAARALRRRVGAQTERALAAADAADAAPDYHALYPGAMVVSLVGLVYSTITPALLPACAMFHTVTYVCAGYNLTFAATAGPGDSGGVLFPRAAAGVGVALLVKHATMAGFYGTIQWTPGGVVSVVLLVGTAAYLSWLRGRFRATASHGAAAYGAAVGRARLAEHRRRLAAAAPGASPSGCGSCGSDDGVDAAAAVAAYTPPPLVPLPVVVANRNGLTGAGAKAVALGDDGSDGDAAAAAAATTCGVGGGEGAAAGDSSSPGYASDGDAPDRSADTLPLYRRNCRGGGADPVVVRI